MTAVPNVLDERFRAAAAASGELDVGYDVLDDTPVGRLLVGVSDRGLCRIGFDPEPDAELERLARQFGPRVLRSPKALDLVRRELDEYFAGRRHAFDLELDLRPTPDFHRRVLEELNRCDGPSARRLLPRLERLDDLPGLGHMVDERELDPLDMSYDSELHISHLEPRLRFIGR